MGLFPFPPPAGIKSDDTTFSREGSWADGNNVRFRLGRAQPIGGWSVLYATVLPSARSLYIHQIGSSEYTVVAVGSQLYAGTGTPADISPSPGPSISGTWALQSYGDILLGVARGDTLYEWDGTGVATKVTQAPDVITDMLVTPERQVLAFGCNEEISGDFNGMCIRGSDIEDYTDWTTSATNNAFEHILEGRGKIIGAKRIGSYIAVWTNHALWMGQFLGDPGQTYRFDKVADDFGLQHVNWVVVVGQTAFWIDSQYRPCMWTPGTQPVVMPCPIWRDFFNNKTAGSDAGQFAWYNPRFNEVWFFYNDARDLNEENTSTRYFAVCLGEEGQPWFRGQIERTAMFDTRGVDFAGNIYQHESGNTLRAWSIQSADFYIDNSQRRAMIRSMVPDFEDQTGDISLTLFVRNYPQSSATTKGPYTLTTSTTKKDFRASGKVVSVKFSGLATTYGRLGKPMFDIVPMGER